MERGLFQLSELMTECFSGTIHTSDASSQNTYGQISPSGQESKPSATRAPSDAHTHHIAKGMAKIRKDPGAIRLRGRQPIEEPYFIVSPRGEVSKQLETANIEDPKHRLCTIRFRPFSRSVGRATKIPSYSVALSCTGKHPTVFTTPVTGCCANHTDQTYQQKQIPSSTVIQRL